MGTTATDKKDFRYTKDKSTFLDSTRRIEGRAREIQRMIGEGSYCVDMVHQLTALTAAADDCHE